LPAFHRTPAAGRGLLSGRDSSIDAPPSAFDNSVLFYRPNQQQRSIAGGAGAHRARSIVRTIASVVARETFVRGRMPR
jgi:hypothetical protein